MKILIAAALVFSSCTLLATDTAFQFKNAEIQDVAEALGKIMGKTFIVDPNTVGHITILPSGLVTPEKAYELFLTALMANGYTVVEQNGSLRILDGLKAKTLSPETYSEIPDTKQEKIITVVFSIKYASVKKLY